MARRFHGARFVGWLALACLAASTACGRPAPDPIAVEEDLRVADSPLLAEVLERGKPSRRARAALAMGRIQSAAYAGPLARAARDGDARVRHAALFALGQLGLARGAEVPGVAFEASLAAARAADPEDAVLGVEALGKLARPGTAERLVPYLAHAVPAVRVEAALALFRLRFVPVWRGESPSAPELPAAAVAALLAALDDPVPEVRRAATYAFSRYPQPGVADALAARLADEDEWTRLFAARSIGLAGDPTVRALEARLGDASPRVRTEVVTALGVLGRAAAIPPALRDDPSIHVRAALARAVATAEDPASAEALALLATDESTTVRGAAIEGLARRDPARFLESADAWLADAAWPIRVAAVRGTGTLGDPGRPRLQRVFERDADPRVRSVALEQLGPGAGEALEAALSADDLALRGTAVGILADGRESADRTARLERAFDESPGEDWIEVRESIVDALAEVDGAGAFLLRAAATDPARSVRTRARQVLARRGSDPAVDVPEAGGAGPSPALLHLPRADPTIRLETPRGSIDIRGHAAEAPVHVAGFVERVRGGFYDGLIWHRVVSNFVVQGGDPRGDGWGTGGVLVRDEIHPRRFDRGTVGMPKAGKDTGGCQIFITHVPTPHLDGNYTVFGSVVAGMDVVDRLEVGDRILRARVLDAAAPP